MAVNDSERTEWKLGGDRLMVRTGSDQQDKMDFCRVIKKPGEHGV